MRLKKSKQVKNARFTFRCTEIELNLIKRKALTYSEGNIAEWILYAAQNCLPDGDDLEDEKAPPKRRGKSASKNHP